MNCYEEVEFVDRGRFATVLRARNTNTNQYVALKKMWVKSSLHGSHGSSSPSPRIHKNYLVHCIEREIKILRILNNHSNIIKLLDTFNSDEYIIIVLEFMNIDLHQLLQNLHIEQERKLTEIECKHITKQLFAGLDALHQNNIVHRDLKPANILFNEYGILKIADLGQARIIPINININNNNKNNDNKYKYNDNKNNKINKNNDKNKSHSFVVRGSQIALCNNDQNENYNDLTNEVGTRWYKSPELLYGTRKYDFSIDIWSAGCIIVEILQCKPLFCGETDIDQLCKIFNILGTINLKYYSDAINLPDFNKIVFNQIQPKQLNILWPQLSDEIIDLIQCCLRFNPNSRITAFDALKHPCFALNKFNINNNNDNDEDEDEIKTDSINLEEFNKLIINATIKLTKARKQKMDTFNDNNNIDDDDDDEVISITSEILNECDLLDIESKQ